MGEPPRERLESALRGRQQARPVLLRGPRADSLIPVPFSERAVNEARLQKLLFDHPILLPVNEIEPVFGPLVPVARELRAGKGVVDLVFVSAEGFITLAETKLWRSPEARREVVAQIIDYAQEMSRWSYEQFVEAVRRARREPGRSDPLLALVARGKFDRRAFVDTVARNLERGRHAIGPVMTRCCDGST